MTATDRSPRSSIGLKTLLLEPRALIMLALGFSSGLPFLLTGNTFGYWLRDEGTSLKLIGFMSWVGMAYSFKVLWAPLIDRVDAPLLGWLGRRRGWMLVSQALVAVGLAVMALIGPAFGLLAVAGVAVMVAFASATQDIVVDAWRIESARDDKELGLLSAAYQLGYRAALLITDALILISANHLGWPISYTFMAVLMSVGLAATFFAGEPARVEAQDSAARMGFSIRGIYDAIIGPFIVFFKAHGAIALLMLVMISLYRLPDFVMGPMANPFYKDLGLSKDVVGSVRASVGLGFSLLGIAAGGVFVRQFGQVPALIVGAVLQGLAVAAFSLLAFFGASMAMFSTVMAVDSFGISFAGVALVTYMSGLTSIGYTATQYALLSSTYAYVGKFLKGFSGDFVERLATTRPLLEAYGIFFLCAGAIGVPALILCILLARAQRRPAAPHAHG